MRKEWGLVAIIATLALSELAFSRPQRMRLGKLKGWTCEEDACGKKYKDGWMLEFHHKVPEYMGGKDTDDNAELLCLPDHAKRHRQLGDVATARTIEGRAKKSKGGRHWDWLRKHP